MQIEKTENELTFTAIGTIRQVCRSHRESLLLLYWWFSCALFFGLCINISGALGGHDG